MSERELLLKGYHRELEKEWNINIPDEMVSLISLFFPKYIDFEGCTISLTDEEKELITNWLIDTFDSSQGHTFMNVTSTLLYDMDKDGDKGEDYHDKCDNHPNTFTIIQLEDYDHIIGFYVNKPIGINPVDLFV